MTDATLHRAGILVTRPRQQSEELDTEIAARGGRAISFPCIDIVGLDTVETARRVASMATPDITIFISTNAVDFGLPFAAGKIAAIGPTTATAIQQAGGKVNIQPATGFDSEHLLQEPDLQNIEDKLVRIIRGSGGREYLGEQLTLRGATVQYVETYERRLPVYSDERLDALEKQWNAGEINAVVVLSVQTFSNLQSLLPDSCREKLASTLLVTHSSRVLKEVLSQYPGCPVTLAGGPQPADIVDCLAAALHAGPPGI